MDRDNYVRLLLYPYGQHINVIKSNAYLTDKPLLQPGPPNGPLPKGKAPRDSPLLHLQQRMQLMTTTIATMMMHQSLHQSHLPCVDAHLCCPLHTTSPVEQTTPDETLQP